jgi:hypothetical protein
MENLSSNTAVTRRRFLRQSFAFSALAALGSLPSVAASLATDPAAADLLMVGDWGYDKEYSPQSAVAVGMRQYAQRNRVEAQALLMLGDNWYGALNGGARSTRWQTQFEQMYPAEVFGCPAYAILGNHDYQIWPDNKVEAELQYAHAAKPGGRCRHAGIDSSFRQKTRSSPFSRSTAICRFLMAPQAVEGISL